MRALSDNVADGLYSNVRRSPTLQTAAPALLSRVDHASSNLVVSMSVPLWRDE
jgi:hypothetical protein